MLASLPLRTRVDSMGSYKVDYRARKNTSNISKNVDEGSGGRSLHPRARSSTRPAAASKKRYSIKSPQPQLRDYFSKSGKEDK